MLTYDAISGKLITAEKLAGLFTDDFRKSRTIITLPVPARWGTCS